MSGGFLTPKGDEIDVTSLQTALSAKIYNANKAARWYPFYFLEAPKISTEQKTIQTMATGQKHVVREGFNDWAFQYQSGGLSLHKNYRLFNGTNFDFVFFDNDAPNWNMLGITGSAATKLKAIPSDGGFFWADPWNPNDGSKIAEYMLQFVYASKYVNDYISTVSGSFDIPSTLPGLIDVNLTASATVNVTSGSFNICIVSPLGVDIGAKYSTALAAIGAWTAAVATSGAALTLTGVVWVPSTTAGVPGYFTVTMATTTPYPGSGSVLINLAASSVLAATPYGAAIESTGAVSIVRN